MACQNIYIGSTRPYAGKNTVAIGLGLRFQKEGFNIGYMKPIGPAPIELENGKTGDEDAIYISSVLGINDSPDLLTPITLTQDFKIRAFNGELEDSASLLGKIEEAHKTLASRHDRMIISGSGSMYSGRYCRLDAVTMIKKMNLKALVLDRVHHEVNYDALIFIKDALGDNLAGVILNDVPPSMMPEIKNIICPFLERNSINVVGVLPQDPLLRSIRTGSLSTILGGRMIAGQKSPDRMVESFLIGTMQVENFMTYFRRANNAAVIVGGDRADVQLVAIEGNCSCLILTGNLFPNDIILSRADSLNIPIIMTREDTYSVAKKMEQMLERHKLRDDIKVRQAAQLVSDNLDFDVIAGAMNR